MTSTSTDRRIGVNASAAIKVAAICASTGNLTLSGEQTIDGIACVEDDRVFAKDQTDASEIGLYRVQTGAWIREPDWDGAGDVREGTIIPVSRGTVNAATFWRVTNTGTITVGTTNITVTQTSLDASAILSDGSVDMAADFLPATDSTHDLGASGTEWAEIHGDTIRATAAVHLDNGQLLMDKGADVASANALTLGSDGNYFDITGTTTITSIGSLGIGTMVVLHFDGALTLTHHASNLILPGAANILTAAGDEAIFIEYAAGQWRCISYQIALRPPGGSDLSGEFYGLGTEHDTDASHDVLINVGKCADATNAVMMELTSVLTKRIDADWAEGDDAGGLASGARSVADTPNASTTYHYFLIAKTDGTVDAGWDTSLTAANLLADATEYTYYRRIVSHLIDGSNNITKQRQDGDIVMLDVASLDVDATNIGSTEVDVAMGGIPTGIEALGFFQVQLDEGGAGAGAVIVRSVWQTDTVASNDNATCRVNTSSAFDSALAQVMTDTSRQITYKGTSNAELKIMTLGYRDIGLRG